ncbi:MAG: gspD 1 [Pedosphaera sp.]|nr:gspD 1 [Pedosphaera sp.]
MKTINQLICLAGLSGGLFAATQGLAADDSATNAPAGEVRTQEANPVQTPQPPTVIPEDTNAQPAAVQPPVTQAPVTTQPPVTQPAVATTPVATADPSIEFAPDKGLRMNFRGVSLETVLTYMSKAAGYVIHPTRNVDVRGKVDVWSDQPLSKEEAVTLLKQILNENGYAVIQDGRMLTILPNAEAKKNGIPVEKVSSFDKIAKNADVVTEIIPVRTLNPIQLLKDLQPLLPTDTTLTANESANSLVMTDTHYNIRRVAEIVAALDSVSSTVNSIKVFPLKYADAKTVAGLIKDLFSSQDSNRAGAGGTGGGNNFGRFRGGGGGRNGGGGGGGGFPGGGFAGMAAMFGGGAADNTGQTPVTKVAAVSDDHSNSVIVSAPDDLIETIKELVEQVDVAVQDVTAVEVFHLQHADPTEMADLLSNLFPDDNNASSASSQPFQFGGRGGFPGFPGGGNRGGAATTASDNSDRMKKMGRVLAVPDRRTSSLVVSASKDLMPQIGDMIKSLDADNSRIQHVYSYSLKNADPMDVQQVLTDLFPASTSSKNSSSTSLTDNPLKNRSTTVQQQQLSGSGSSIGGVGGSTSSGGGRSF